MGACTVWDGADAHLLAIYGFLIIGIIKYNPEVKARDRPSTTLCGHDLRHHGRDGNVKLYLYLQTR